MPPDAEAPASLASPDCAATIDLECLTSPLHRGVVHCMRDIAVGGSELCQKVMPKDDAPAVGGVRRLAFVHDEVLTPIELLHQNREVETGGPCTDARDVHTWSDNWRFGDFAAPKKPSAGSALSSKRTMRLTVERIKVFAREIGMRS